MAEELSPHDRRTAEHRSGARGPQLESSPSATTAAHVTPARVSVLQQKLPQDATKILSAVTKIWCSQSEKEIHLLLL